MDEFFEYVKKEDVIQSIDAETIYDVPNLMLAEGLDEVVLKKFNLSSEQQPELRLLFVRGA